MYLTTIMEDNRPAKEVLLSGRFGLPAYHDLGGFCCMAVGLQPGAPAVADWNSRASRQRSRRTGSNGVSES